MLPVKGGSEFYQIQSRYNGHVEDRTGGILLKTSGTTSGRMNEEGTCAVIYHGGNKINETKNYIGPYISQIAAEYISLIIGIKLVRRIFRLMNNKVLIINIKS